MKTNIVVTLQVEGIHCWPEAGEKAPSMSFLAEMHRHMFHIIAKKEVTHDNRDIEIILFKRDLQTYLETRYYVQDRRCLNLGPSSCEMIAKDLLIAFNLDYCQVLEDLENGAEVWK